jgi:hypothetical protein
MPNHPTSSRSAPATRSVPFTRLFPPRNWRSRSPASSRPPLDISASEKAPSCLRGLRSDRPVAGPRKRALNRVEPSLLLAVEWRWRRRLGPQGVLAGVWPGTLGWMTAPSDSMREFGPCNKPFKLTDRPCHVAGRASAEPRPPAA